MSKGSVLFLILIFASLILLLNHLYLTALNQNLEFTKWVLWTYCPRGIIK